MSKLRTPPVIWAYTRVSTDKQSLVNQEHEILKFANERNWTIRRFVENTASTRRAEKERKVDVLRSAATEGKVDVIVFSELSRLGRSLGEIVRLLEFFESHGVTLYFVKERMDTSNKDMATKVMLTIFALLADIERDLISERTKAGLAARKAAGQRLGRPPGRSKLDRHEVEIRELAELGVTQRRLAQRFDCTPQTMSKWLRRKRPEWRRDGLKQRV